jgi:hypothetical protein
MEGVTQTTNGGTRSLSSRETAPQAQASDTVLKLDPIKDTIAELVRLYRAQRDATTDLADAIEAAATRSAARPAVVRRFVAARAGDKFVERKSECEQLAFLFERLGE